jgi:hypothetical protein
MHKAKYSLEVAIALLIIWLFLAAMSCPVIAEGTNQTDASQNVKAGKAAAGSAPEIGTETAGKLLKRVETLEKEVNAIQMRNRKVEGDKAWEISHTRHFIVLLITYILATVVLWMLSIEKPYLGALIPTLGYFLSTLTLEGAKDLWIANYFVR